jgi:hypothetical protein
MLLHCYVTSFSPHIHLLHTTTHPLSYKDSSFLCPRSTRRWNGHCHISNFPHSNHGLIMFSGLLISFSFVAELLHIPCYSIRTVSRLFYFQVPLSFFLQMIIFYSPTGARGVANVFAAELFSPFTVTHTNHSGFPIPFRSLDVSMSRPGVIMGIKFDGYCSSWAGPNKEVSALRWCSKLCVVMRILSYHLKTF